MRLIFGIFLFAIFAFSSCSHPQPKTGEIGIISKAEFDKVDRVLSKYGESSQIFRGSDRPMKIVCKHGTTIFINPADLETENGEALGDNVDIEVTMPGGSVTHMKPSELNQDSTKKIFKNIDIEVKEVFNQKQFVSAGVQTVSNGNLLVSGGALYINVTSYGAKLKLKKGKTYSVELPKTSEEEMGLYYGAFDSTNKMSWEQSDQFFTMPRPDQDSISSSNYEVLIVTGQGKFRDTVKTAVKNLSGAQMAELKKQTEISDKIYSPIRLNKFGWINCDHWYDSDSPRTDVQFTITNKPEEVNFVKTYLVFKDINSVMQAFYYNWDNKIDKDNFKNIPVGQTVKFFAICYQHGKIFAALTNEMNVTSNQNEDLNLKEMSEADFDKLMERL